MKYLKLKGRRCCLELDFFVLTTSVSCQWVKATTAVVCFYERWNSFTIRCNELPKDKNTPLNLILLRNSQIFVVVAYFPLVFVLQIKFLESFDFRLAVQMTSKWNANWFLHGSLLQALERELLFSKQQNNTTVQVYQCNSQSKVESTKFKRKDVFKQACR